jgi:hypothetical protein
MKQLIELLRAAGINPLASACGGITSGADYDCDAPVVPGVNQRLLLGNLDDIESITFNITTPSLIEGITMKSTKAMFPFQGVRQSLTPSYEMVPGTVSVGYNHIVPFLAFDISQEAKDNYEKMALGKLFAILENKNAVGNGNSIFEVYGINVGLEANAMTRAASDQESGGAFNITLQTPENEGKEPKLPQSFFLTDYATTLALVDALLIPAP